jgi:amino acid transporter
MDTETDAAQAKPRYSQQLHRSIGVLGNIFITLSGVTPAASVFVIAPAALVAVGSGTFLSFVFAAIVGVFMALCWAELSAAFPIAGGDYAMVWHAYRGKAKPLAGPVSFIVFALYIDFIAFIPATIALGAGVYMDVVWNVNGKYLGAAVMLITAGIAIFKIKFNAWLTGVFLALELIALLTLTVLGFSHAKHWGALIHPVVGSGAHGLLVPVAFSGVLAFTATAIFSYNGYSSAVNFSEETTGGSRTIATAILWSLVITVAAELIPLTAAILGAPSLAQLSNPNIQPLQYVIEATSNKGVNTVLSLGIVLAVLNATLAIVLSNSRILFSGARDKAFPGPVGRALAHIHPGTKSPWVATAVVGILGAIMCLTVSLDTLVNLTGASLVADYALIALAAIVARLTGATKDSPYRMKFWPLPPLIALAALGYVFDQQTKELLLATLITMAIGLVYWAIVILPQRGKAWQILEPAENGE